MLDRHWRIAQDIVAAVLVVTKDSPVNGTSATVFRLMSDS